MPQFKLRPEGFAKVKKRVILRFAVIFVFLLSFFIICDSQQKNKVNDAAAWPFIIAIMLVFIFFALKKALKYRLTLYSSYTLVIENDKITRLQQNTPAITINFNDIANIQKDTEGQIIINGAKPMDTIYVPPNIENSDKFEYVLEQITPISANVKIPFAQKYSLLITLLFLIMIVSVYVVNDKIAVGVCGTCGSIFLIAVMVGTRINKNTDKKAKRNMVYLLIMLVSVITTMFIKLRR